MNSKYTYFLILSASIVVPFILSFDKKVAFYKKWKYVFAAMILPAVFYIIWDVYFTAKGIWRFNSTYIIGIKIFNLPIEECLFFIIVPYCCTFIYECIRCYFPQLQNKKIADLFLKLLAIILLVTGISAYNKMYTTSTFIFLATSIGSIYLLKKKFETFDAASFLIAFTISLIPFFIVDGLLTSLPILIYNNAENLGLRIYTIPFEDIFYAMLLMLMNIVIYEHLKQNA